MSIPKAMQMVYKQERVLLDVKDPWICSMPCLYSKWWIQPYCDCCLCSESKTKLG